MKVIRLGKDDFDFGVQNRNEWIEITNVPRRFFHYTKGTDMAASSDSERRVLEMALEFYVRLGLGQFSQIAQRLDLLCGKRLSAETLRKVRRAMDRLEGLVWDGKPWMLRDEDTSIYTLTGSLVDARMTGDDKFVEWAEKRVNEKIKAGETVR